MHFIVQTVLWTLIMIDSGLHEGSTIPNISKTSAPSFEVKDLHIGMLIGAFMSLFMIDRIGRKTTLMTTGFPKIFSWFLLDFINNPLYLRLGRIIAGIGCGMVYVTLPIYLCEITPKGSRGSIGLLMGVFNRVGVLCFFSSISSISRWIPMLVICILPIVYGFCHKFTFESPDFFVRRGKLLFAEETLQGILQKEDIEGEIVEVMNRTEMTQNIIPWKESLIALYKKPESAKAMNIVNTLTSGLAFTGWFPVMIFQFYAFGVNIKIGHFSNTIYALCMILTSSAGVIFLPNFGRKATLIASHYLMFSATILGLLHAVCLKSGSSDAESVRELGFFIYGIVYATGYGLAPDTLPFVYIGEVFCSKVKVVGVVLCTLCYILKKILLANYYEFMLNHHQQILLLVVLLIIMIIIFYFSARCVSENDDKSLFEIQMELRNTVEVDFS